jgi:hypothetical protein
LWKKRKASLAFPAGLPSIKDEATVAPQDGNYVVQLDEPTVQPADKAAEQMAKQAEQIANGYIRQAERRRGSSQQYAAPGKQKPTA